MATPATQERTSTNSAITTAPREAVAHSQPQQLEIPDVFQEEPETPQVSEGFWSKVGRYSGRYAEIKLRTGYLTQI